MDKIPILMREPRMWDYNKIAYAINKIIDKLEKKIEIHDLEITKYVKDFSFFKWLDYVELPYTTSIIISNIDDYNNLLSKYNIGKKDAKEFKEIIDNWDVITLSINIIEDLTKKDLKQEEMFNTITSIKTEDLLNDSWKMWENDTKNHWKMWKEVKQKEKKTKTKAKKDEWSKVKKKK